jgi:hypothetical protein
MSSVDSVFTTPRPFRPVGSHTANSSLATAVTLTAPSGATKLLIQALTQNVRLTLDNTTPTASVGFQLKAADPAVIIPISGGTTIKVIEETASGVIQYQWGN